VVTHELGHVIGLDHDDHGVMAPVLEVGPSVVSGPLFVDAGQSSVGRGPLSIIGDRETRHSAVDRVLAESLRDDLRVAVAEDEEDEVLERLFRPAPSGEEVDALFAQFAAE
jgi:hypothetical protein